MQWASKLPDYSSVLSFYQSLPEEIIREQVVLYRNRSAETAVAVATKQDQKIRLNPKSRYTLRMTVASRFHLYCQSRGIVFEERFPYGIIKKQSKTTSYGMAARTKTNSCQAKPYVADIHLGAISLALMLSQALGNKRR